MAEENLEQKANAPPQNRAEEKKPMSVLESVVNETFSAFKSGVNLGVGIAAPAAGYALTGNAGVPVVSAAFVAGSGGNLTSKKIRNESIVGTLWETMLHYFSLPLKYMSNLGKSAYVALLPFASNSIVPTADHLINNKSPKGLYEKLRKSYWPNVKKTFKTVWPLNLLSTLFFSQPAYIVGAMGVANYLFRKFIVKGTVEEQTDKTPYFAAAPSVAGKLIRNPVKGMYEAVSAIGSSLSDLYISAPAATPKPAAQPAPAN